MPKEKYGMDEKARAACSQMGRPNRIVGKGRKSVPYLKFHYERNG